MKKLKIKDIIFILIMLAGLAMFVVQKFTSNGQNTPDGLMNLHIGDATVLAEVADSDQERYLGLGNRDSMDFNRAMIFIHDGPSQYSYSMRGMRFDLDFIFIRDGKIVDIARNVAYEYPGTIKGAAEYDRVLEVNSGWVRANGVKIGDEVTVAE